MKLCRPVVCVPMKHIGAGDGLYVGGFALRELGIRVMVSASFFAGYRCGPVVNSCLL